MSRRLASLFALLCICAMPLPGSAQTDIAAILASPDRPQAERDRDAGRKPQEVIEFFGIGPGDEVADLLTGGGYWARILVPLVGADGRVYAGNNPFFARFFTEPLDALLAEPAFANVVRIDGPVDELALPTDGSLDAVIMMNAYHDIYLTDEDRGALNRTVFAALRPGGVYGIVDHEAGAGVGTSAVQSLHRIEKQAVVDEVTAAGFALAAEGDFLRNPADDHTGNVNRSPMAGMTDRFVLRFEKPAK